MGDEATDWHPREAIEQRQNRLPDRAANVFEIDVDAARTGFGQLFRELFGPVIDHGVEAELIADIRTLLGAAGDSDCARTGQFGKLADERADRAARSRDDDH